MHRGVCGQARDVEGGDEGLERVPEFRHDRLDVWLIPQREQSRRRRAERGRQLELFPGHDLGRLQKP